MRGCRGWALLLATTDVGVVTTIHALPQSDANGNVVVPDSGKLDPTALSAAGLDGMYDAADQDEEAPSRAAPPAPKKSLLGNLRGGHVKKTPNPKHDAMAVSTF